MEKHAQTVTGGCMCGAVRYEAPEPHAIVYCHCQSCRKHTGAAVATLVGYLKNEIKWIGHERKTYRSSQDIKRGFCDKCGTPLSWEGFVEELGGDLIEVFVSTTDNPDVLIPSFHIWHEERIKWFEIADDLPRYRGWAHDGSKPYSYGPIVKAPST